MENRIKKIIIIRFSSIGDIAWTSPVFRLIKEQIPNVEIHFCTKKSFRFLVQNNPHIHKIHYLEDSLWELIKALRKEKFDVVIDLHNKIRSILIKLLLFTKCFTYTKLNFRRFLFTKFQWDVMPKGDHIVKRYIDTLKPLGIKDDGKGLEFYFSKEDEVQLTDFPERYVGMVIGATKFTKKLSLEKSVELIQKIPLPVVLIGGQEDLGMATAICNSKLLDEKRILNCAGKYTISQSAFILKNSEYIIGHDTGLTHISAAFGKKIYSIWAGTSPKSFEPFRAENIILENNTLTCRPCSKSGLDACPQKHFKCINDLNFENLEFNK